MPPDWGYHNDFELVVAGYDIWEASDFQRFPTKDEVANIDPDWREDLFQFRKQVKMQRKKDLTIPQNDEDSNPALKHVNSIKVRRRPGS